MIVRCLYDKLVPIHQLKKHPRNRNSHPPEQIKELAEILKYQGWRYPIKVSKQSGFITAGHGRLLAAVLNNWTEAPVNFQDYDSFSMEYEDVQADNAVALWAQMDLDKIKQDLLELKDVNPQMLGIKDFKLDDIIKKEPGCDEDEIPAHVEPKTKIGDIYKLGNHRLMCADSTSLDAVEKLMNGQKADMVFTDPPYGVSYEKKTQEIANQSKTRYKSTIMNDDLTVDGLKDVLSAAFSNLNLVLADKSCYYVCSPQGGELGLMMMMMMMQEANLICRHMIIWVKNAPVFSMNRLDYDYKHEPILFGWSKNRTHNKLMEGDFKNSVWEVPREQNKVHPTMKPVVLPENAIKNSCPHGGNVVDLFGGSGSTLIACEKTNRKCFMMELDPHYCDVIISRFEKYSGKKAELINGTA